MKPLSRREFFRASTFVALGAVAAACAKKIPRINGRQSLAQITTGHSQTLQMNSADFEILSGKPDRLVFNLIDPSNGAALTTPTAQVWIALDQKSAATGPLTANYRDEGLPKDKGFYEVQLTVPSDGTWLAVAEVQRTGKSSSDFGAAQFQIGRRTAMPKQGDPATSVPTPTYSDHRGVDPICTAKPICSMHAISLDAALKNGKPTVLIIATPQFCQSALCGPETELVGEVSKDFSGRINFIHIEVYKDNKATTIQRQVLSPAAALWHLDEEPVIYYIDPAGLIKSRTIGPADKGEVRAAANALIA
jgi:hypothetical protein